MEIALDLDAKERELMAELGTDTSDYLKYDKVRYQINPDLALLQLISS